MDVQAPPSAVLQRLEYLMPRADRHTKSLHPFIQFASANSPRDLARPAEAVEEAARDDKPLWVHVPLPLFQHLLAPYPTGPRPRHPGPQPPKPGP